MSYRAYHDYDDDRDVITCVTLSDTRPVARKEHTCGGCKKTIPVGRATAAGSCSSTASTTNPDGQAAGVRAVTPSPATAGGSCWR
jgi:hypothetical protein